jgi:putative ABC transport system substrate-binding protein
VQLQPLEARTPNDFDGSFAAMATQRAGALLVIGDVMFVTHRTRLVELAAKNRLPVMYPHREYVETGGLMAYGPDLRDIFRRAAYVDRLLKGAKPADLPVEQPTKFELVLNLQTAKALGLTIPQTVLSGVDEIIQ